MNKEEIALQLTLMALDNNNIELAKQNETDDKDKIISLNALNAQIIAHFYQSVLKNLD